MITRNTGTVNIGYEDAEEGVTVIFGAVEDPPIMGVTTLESLGFEVEPVGEKLNRVEMLLL